MKYVHVSRLTLHEDRVVFVGSASAGLSEAMKSTAIFIHDTTLSHMDLITADGGRFSSGSSRAARCKNASLYYVYMHMYIDYGDCYLQVLI